MPFSYTLMKLENFSLFQIAGPHLKSRLGGIPPPPDGPGRSARSQFSLVHLKIQVDKKQEKSWKIFL